MGSKLKGNRPTRRFVRVSGPFDGYYLGRPTTPVFIYELNLGGCFVNFLHPPPKESKFEVQIDLPKDGPITVNAEEVYRHQFGIAVRFVDLDTGTANRLSHAVESLTGHA